MGIRDALAKQPACFGHMGQEEAVSSGLQHARDTRDDEKEKVQAKLTVSGLQEPRPPSADTFARKENSLLLPRKELAPGHAEFGERPSR